MVIGRFGGAIRLVTDASADLAAFAQSQVE
jgi:hypothetical protein